MNGGAGETGRDVVAVLGGQLGQPVAGAAAVVVVEHVEGDRKGVDRWGVARDRAVAPSMSWT